MSRLIDADELKATIKAVCCHSEDESDLLDAVEQIPSVDAVEVVHCRDCKWLHIVNDNILYGFCTKGHAMFYPFQLDSREFYCADGERRDPCS